MYTKHTHICLYIYSCACVHDVWLQPSKHTTSFQRRCLFDVTDVVETMSCVSSKRVSLYFRKKRELKSFLLNNFQWI